MFSGPGQYCLVSYRTRRRRLAEGKSGRRMRRSSSSSNLARGYSISGAWTGLNGLGRGGKIRRRDILQKAALEEEQTLFD